MAIAELMAQLEGQDTSSQRAELEYSTPVPFIVHFRRCNDYDGEFGFDWMREEYKNICSNYEELKKEYNSLIIAGKEYFIPWLSMYANHKDKIGKPVKLILELDIISHYDFKDDDTIVIESEGQFDFEQNEISLSEFQRNGNKFEVEVKCNTPISTNICVNVKHKENIVGALNIIRNDTQYNVPIYFIRLLEDLNLAKSRERAERANNYYLGDITDTWSGNVIDRVNKSGLNQALIQCKKASFEDKMINVSEWIERGYLSEDKRIIKSNFRQPLKQFCTNRGVYVFLSGFMYQYIQDGAAYASTSPTEDSIIVCYPNVNPNGDKYAREVLVHEIGHILGLGHFFDDTRQRYLNENINEINRTLAEIELLSDNNPVKYGDVTKTTKAVRDELKVAKKTFEEELSLRPNYNMEMLKTENVMDYPINSQTREKNPYSDKMISLNKPQWLLMQYEIKRYHGTKE